MLQTSKNSTSRHLEFEKTDPDIGVYFTKLRWRLIAGLLVCFIIPVLVVMFYFHRQFNTSLLQSNKIDLKAFAQSQGNSIDLFLQERVINLFSLFRNADFSTAPSLGQMEADLKLLNKFYPDFADLGFIDHTGRQIGYAGKYTGLLYKNYKDESWYRQLINSSEDYLVSNIHLGFRKAPHFTIAVKTVIDGKPYVIRTAFSPEAIHKLLKKIKHGKPVGFEIIDSAGNYQMADTRFAKTGDKAAYLPPKDVKASVVQKKHRGDNFMIAHTWLDEADWVLMVTKNLSIVHAQLYKSRMIITLVLIGAIVLAGVVILAVTSNLISSAQAAAEKKREMRSQLLHATKLASLGELATGIAHEINNPLAVITSTSGIVHDMFDPDVAIEPSFKKIKESLNIIDSAAYRAKGITRQLLDFGRKKDPKLQECDINKLLDDVLSGLKEREFELANIELVRKYQKNLPKVQADPDQLMQVFFNLINNAGDAIGASGTITIITRVKKEYVRIIVTDDGCGMSEEQMAKIFSPFFTTKPEGKGTGLGLSISLNIIEALGGMIDVRSQEGHGSRFVVSLPLPSK